jgi:hypothetical protein
MKGEYIGRGLGLQRMKQVVERRLSASVFPVKLLTASAHMRRAGGAIANADDRSGMTHGAFNPKFDQVL